MALACVGGGFLATLAAAPSPLITGPYAIPLIWPPTGIAIAAVWRFGAPALLGSGIASFAMGWLFTDSPFGGALLGIGSLLPPLIVEWQLRRRGVTDIFNHAGSVLRFSIIAGLLAPVLSASISVLTYLYFGHIETFGRSWLLWWSCEVVAVLLITPSLLSLGGWREVDGRRKLELAGLAAAIVALWWLAFLGSATAPVSLAILVMPLMIGLSLRYNFSAVANISLLLAIISIVATSHGPGPYDVRDPYANLIYMHLFIAVLACSSLVIAAGSATLRKAFQQLSTNEERFRAVFEQAAVGFMVRDMKTNTRLINRKLHEQLGYEADEFPENSWVTLSHPDDLEFTEKMLEPLRNRTSDHVQFEKRYLRKDGSVMWADINASVAHTGTPGEDPTFSIVVVNDISQRKRVEKQLQGQTRILRSLAASAPLPQLLDELALLAEELWPNMRCAIYLSDNKAQTLRFGAAPSFPSEAEHERDLLIPIGPSIGVGCTSLAASRNATVIAADTLTDPTWEYIRFVPQQRPWQRACWATPFASIAGEMLGVVTLYFEESCEPTAADHELIAMLTSLAGIVIQRHDDARKLRAREKMFRGIFEQAAVGVVLLDIAGEWLEINDLFCQIVGYSREELLQRVPYRKLLAPEGYREAMATRDSLARGEVDHYQAERCYIRKDGQRIAVDIAASLVRDEQGRPERQIIVVQDVSERKRAEAEIERLALYDYLTELPNRRLFNDRLKQALANAHRSGHYGALLYVDLDNFKQLNDTHGHSAGDELLKLVATRLQDHLRENDTVARLGGDEFIILLQDVGATFESATEATARIGRKIQLAFDTAFKLQRGIEHTVSASLGITLFPKGNETAEDLLKEADIAMYRVKAQQQQNAILFYEPEMQVAADSRLAVEQDLRIAVQRQQFAVFLQPQVDRDGITVGYEALLRWPHPDHGMVSPAMFIPIAEETGLIVPIGEWVLRMAARYIHRMAHEGVERSIAVNVSPRQFSEPNFVDRVRTVLWEEGADAGQLILEITEGTVVTDFAATSAKMEELKLLGIRLSVDDFGTGHSSLSYLKRLPIHELKIDRSFVTDLPDDDNDAALVDAILSVAHHLELNVVAEGVETAEQLHFLREHGCSLFQGYFIGMPKPAGEYLPFLEGSC